jgi:uncharacterized protein
VLEVDLQRRRIALTLRLGDAGPRARPEAGRQAVGEHGRNRPPSRGSSRPDSRPKGEPQSNGVMADALRRAMKR